MGPMVSLEITLAGCLYLCVERGKLLRVNFTG